MKPRISGVWALACAVFWIARMKRGGGFVRLDSYYCIYHID